MLQVSSISGSDTDSSLNNSDDELAALGSDRHWRSQAAAVQGAQVVFRTADTSGFAVWRCLLLPDSHKHKQEEPSPQQLLQLLRQLKQSADSSSARLPAAAANEQQQQQQLDTAGCIWVLLMLRGGHFAAAVVRIHSSSRSNRAGHASSSSDRPTAVQQQHPSSSGQQPEPQQQRPRVQQPGPAGEPFTVVAHKTFHRYVVRQVFFDRLGRCLINIYCNPGYVV